MTLLKDMQFNRPVLGGVIESNNAKYIMGCNDVLAMDMGGGHMDTIIDYDYCNGQPYFHGWASCVNWACSADSANNACYAESSGDTYCACWAAYAESAGCTSCACWASFAENANNVYTYDMSGSNLCVTQMIQYVDYGCLSALPSCARILYYLA